MLLISTLVNNMVDLRQNMMGSPYLFLLGACAGIILVLSISGDIKSKKLRFIGRYSILFFLWEAFARDIIRLTVNHINGTQYTPMIDLPLHYAIFLFPFVVLLTYFLTKLTLPLYSKYISSASRLINKTTKSK